jgi:hypothetical protein
MKQWLAAALFAPALLVVVALSVAHSGARPFVDHLPACRSGWRFEAALAPQKFRYIPFRYVMQVTPHALPGTIAQVLSPDGHVVATVRRGQSVAFDCFDDNGDTI